MGYGPGPSLRPGAVPLSDKLFDWVFQNNPDWILALQPDLAQAPGGYRFPAPALWPQGFCVGADFSSTTGAVGGAGGASADRQFRHPPAVSWHP